MTTVDHDYLDCCTFKNFNGSGQDVVNKKAVDGTYPNGTDSLPHVTILMNVAAENVRLEFTNDEWDTFCRLKNEMRDLFNAAETRMASNQAATPPPIRITGVEPEGMMPPPGPPHSPVTLYHSKHSKGVTLHGKTVAPPSGCNCKRCGAANEYAAPNQADGTYLCYGCRP